MTAELQQILRSYGIQYAEVLDDLLGLQKVLLVVIRSMMVWACHLLDWFDGRTWFWRSLRSSRSSGGVVSWPSQLDVTATDRLLSSG